MGVRAALARLVQVRAAPPFGPRRAHSRPELRAGRVARWRCRVRGVVPRRDGVRPCRRRHAPARRDRLPAEPHPHGLRELSGASTCTSTGGVESAGIAGTSSTATCRRTRAAGSGSPAQGSMRRPTSASSTRCCSRSGSISRAPTSSAGRPTGRRRCSISLPSARGPSSCTGRRDEELDARRAGQHRGIADPSERLQRASTAVAVEGGCLVCDPVDADGLDALLAGIGPVLGALPAARSPRPRRRVAGSPSRRAARRAGRARLVGSILRDRAARALPRATLARDRPLAAGA